MGLDFVKIELSVSLWQKNCQRKFPTALFLRSFLIFRRVFALWNGSQGFVAWGRLQRLKGQFEQDFAVLELNLRFYWRRIFENLDPEQSWMESQKTLDPDCQY